MPKEKQIKQTGSRKTFFLGVLLFLGSGIALSVRDHLTFSEPKPTQSEEKPVVCTMEAKLCPDGSSVGRSGPNCEFAPCPNANVEKKDKIVPVSTRWKTVKFSDPGFSMDLPDDWSAEPLSEASNYTQFAMSSDEYFDQLISNKIVNYDEYSRYVVVVNLNPSQRPVDAPNVKEASVGSTKLYFSYSNNQFIPVIDKVIKSLKELK